MSEPPVEHWDFLPGAVTYANYTRGRLPRLRIVATCNGVRMGEIEVHLHHNRAGTSYGVTVIDYDPPTEGPP